MLVKEKYPLEKKQTNSVVVSLLMGLKLFSKEQLGEVQKKLFQNTESKQGNMIFLSEVLQLYSDEQLENEELMKGYINIVDPFMLDFLLRKENIFEE